MFKIASENLIFSEVGSHSDIYCKSHNKVGNLQVSSNQMERTQNMLLVQLWENLESKYYAPMSKINLQHILHMTSNICTYYLRFGGTGPFLEQTSFKRKSWRSSVDHLIFVAELILGDISQLQLLQSDLWWSLVWSNCWSFPAFLFASSLHCKEVNYESITLEV